MKKIMILLLMFLLVGCTDVTKPIENESVVPTAQPGKDMLVHFINVGQGRRYLDPVTEWQNNAD